MRVLALDVGDKTIGIAVSDALNITAQGVETYYRETVKNDVAHIIELCQQLQVTTVVYGDPIHLNGSPSRQSEKVAAFIRQLQKKIKYGGRIDWPIEFQAVDERLTSRQAENLMKLADLSRKKRTDYVDKLAAQLILEQFLAMRKNER